MKQKRITKHPFIVQHDQVLKLFLPLKQTAEVFQSLKQVL